MTAASTQAEVSSRRPQVRVELCSNALLLSGARELVSAVAKRFGFSDESCGQIALAVDEALCNVIRHGYDRQPDRPIWLSIYAEGNGWDPGGAGKAKGPGAGGGGVGGCDGTGTGGGGMACGRAAGIGHGAGGCSSGACRDDSHPDAIRIIIEDEARQVDPAVIKSRNLDEVRPGGLGVHIIKSVMDEVRYEPRERIGMRLTMLKRRSAAISGAEAGKGGASHG